MDKTLRLGQNMEKKLYIYGLPRTGTWFLENLICQNFNFNKRNNKLKHTLIPESPLHEHNYKNFEEFQNSNDVRLVIYKNPYKWIESLFFRPPENIRYNWYNTKKSLVNKKPINKFIKKFIFDWSNCETLYKAYFDNSLNNDFLDLYGCNFICDINSSNKHSIDVTFLIPFPLGSSNITYNFDLHYTISYWKKHFEIFNKMENKLIIYYEDLLDNEKRISLLKEIEKQFNIFPRNEEWDINIESQNVLFSEHFDENIMIPYYKQENKLNFLETQHLNTIKLALGDKWLEKNTIYKTL